jgi:phage gp46-like protein
MKTATPEWAADPKSDLITATELHHWKRNRTTQKIMRYLSRYRAQLVESLAEGDSTSESVEATAMKTAEYVSKAQMLKDIATLAPEDIAQFYGLETPQDPE